MVTKSDEKTISLVVTFLHPFEDLYMNMAKPAKFGVMVRGRKTDLLETLREKKIGEFSAWQANYRIKTPGDHIFYVEPKPYWEPDEETTERIIRVLTRSSKSYMIISQDRGLLAKTTHCTLRMANGKLEELTGLSSP
jgi:hypothetical protein